VLLTTVLVTVGLSVLAHGVTAAPLARRYAGWFETHPRTGAPAIVTGRARPVRWRAP
jgi:hypothetical protein